MTTDIDRQVAELMGRQKDKDEAIDKYLIEKYHHYSTDIAQAMEVVEKMIADGHLANIYYGIEGKWEIMFHKYRSIRVSDKSLPMAICLAALKAKEDK